MSIELDAAAGMMMAECAGGMIGLIASATSADRSRGAISGATMSWNGLPRRWGQTSSSWASPGARDLGSHPRCLGACLALRATSS
jgi:hypothetical protein